MFSSFSIILFHVIMHHSLIHIANAIQTGDDKMLIAFVRNNQKMQISEYSTQKYEAHLGIMNFMKKNWQCDKIATEFKEYERTECLKYRKYLDILYEYLSSEYAGMPTVKPKLVYKNKFEIESSIIVEINCLARILRFYFIKLVGKYTLNYLFTYLFEPKLLNEKRLNYEIKLENEPKLTINEFILQLAIDTANEWQTNENLDGIIRQKFDNKFEEYLEKIFKKAEKKTKVDDYWRRANQIILDSKFDEQWTWNEDALFSEFVKGLVTNFKKFFKMAKEYSNYLFLIKEQRKIPWDGDEQMVSFGLYEFEKMKKYLTQKYEALLGVMYLMRKNWHCEKIVEEFEENKRTECQKYHNYLDILYEYLFRLYVEAKSDELANKFPAVKPIYQTKIIFVVVTLNDALKYFMIKGKNILRNFVSNELVLKNEVEFNHESKEEENWFHKNGPNGKQILNRKMDIKKIWQEFEQKMKKMYENAIESAKEEMAKLEKAIENAGTNKEKRILSVEYNNKFRVFISSPFLQNLNLCKSFPNSCMFLAFVNG